MLVVALGFGTAAWSQNRQARDPGSLERAQAETAALKQDFVALAKARDKAALTKCSYHKRLYTFAQDKKYAEPLAAGTFASMVGPAMPEARAEFFLDPWNSPYWVRDRCDEDKEHRVLFIYSFGPNRQRDSSRWEILGDDIGAYVIRNPVP